MQILADDHAVVVVVVVGGAIDKELRSYSVVRALVFCYIFLVSTHTRGRSVLLQTEGGWLARSR